MPRVVYLQWSPAVITGGRIGDRMLLNEPPHLAFGPHDRLVGIGLEARAIGQEPGHTFYNFSSMKQVGEAPDKAAIMLLWYASAIADHAPLALYDVFLPWLRSYVVIHLLDGAETGLASTITAALRRHLGKKRFRGIYFLVGPGLDPRRLVESDLRHLQWVDGIPPW